MFSPALTFELSYSDSILQLQERKKLGRFFNFLKIGKGKVNEEVIECEIFYYRLGRGSPRPPGILNILVHFSKDLMAFIRYPNDSDPPQIVKDHNFI